MSEKNWEVVIVQDPKTKDKTVVLYVGGEPTVVMTPPVASNIGNALVGAFLEIIDETLSHMKGRISSDPSNKKMEFKLIKPD
jgi:hypothetical protein